MEINPVKIILREGVQDALDHFTACFDIRIAFFNTNYDELKVGLSKPACEFCKLLRSKLKLEQKCLKDDARNLEKASRSGKMVVYRCHAGLTEAIKPVNIDGEMIGFVMMGQFRDTGMISPELHRKWEMKFPEDPAFTDAFEKVPYFHPEKVRHICGMFEILVDNTIKNNYYRIEGELHLLKIRDYLRRRLDRPVSIGEVAAHLHCSESSLSHFIRKHTGISFKRMLIEMKLEAAEKILKESTRATVKSAAAAAGYYDPYYFSRIFRKYRGFPPSAVRKT